MFTSPKDVALKWRMTALMIFCFGLGTLILARASYMQLASQPRLELLAKRQFESHAWVRPRRGAILDRNGEALAIGVESYSLAANPNKIIKKKEIARLLSRVGDLPARKILLKLQEQREFVWIYRHLSDAQLKSFKKWKLMDAEGDLMNGLWMVKENARVYPHRQLAAQTLGDVNIDSEGIEGLELLLNESLRGRVGSVSAVKDALGRPTFIDAEAAKSVQNGEPVLLSLDVRLQYAVEQKLQNAVKKTGAVSGTVIVMNAETGELVALANEPTFDRVQKGIAPDKRRNRAITDGYEPGSILKPILLAGALAHGAKLTDQVYGELGSYILQGHRISEAEVKERFAWISLKKMIQVSSNIGAAKVALKLGAESYQTVLKRFGFGLKTGVAFPGEIAGRIPPVTTWGQLGLANIGFGQGILVTPLQIARAYAVFLNGGFLVKPTLYAHVSGVEHLPADATRIISQKVSHDVLSALQSVVEKEGTGSNAALPGFRVAGKTGTAQMVDPKTKKYSREKHIASFVGFALGAEPKFVIFTALNEPKGVYYASETAAPLFKEVLASVVNRFSLPVNPAWMPTLAHNVGPTVAAKNSRDSEQNTLNDVLVSTAAAPTAESSEEISPQHLKQSGTQSEEFIVQVNPKTQKTGWIMPTLIGLTPREALLSLKGHDLVLHMAGAGVVSTQHPAPGQWITSGGRIRLDLGEISESN